METQKLFTLYPRLPPNPSIKKSLSQYDLRSFDTENLIKNKDFGDPEMIEEYFSFIHNEPKAFYKGYYIPWIVLAAYFGNECMFFYCIENVINDNFNFNKCYKFLGMDILHFSIMGNSAKIIDYLLSNIEFHSYLTKDSSTPIHTAIKYSNDDTLYILFNYESIKQLVNIQDSNGITPLLLAIRSRSLEAIQFLLDNGANPYIFDYKNNNVFHYIHSGALFLQKHLQSCKCFVFPLPRYSF